MYLALLPKFVDIVFRLDKNEKLNFKPPPLAADRVKAGTRSVCDMVGAR